MKFRVDVICLNEDGVVTRCEVMKLERGELAMETLGLSLRKAKLCCRVSKLS
jgi:hypothetical protein